MTVDTFNLVQKQPGQRYRFHLSTASDYPVIPSHEERALDILGTLEKIVNPETQSFDLRISTSSYKTDIQLVVQQKVNQEELNEVELEKGELQVLVAIEKVFDEISVRCNSIDVTIDETLEEIQRIRNEDTR